MKNNIFILLATLILSYSNMMYTKNKNVNLNLSTMGENNIVLLSQKQEVKKTDTLNTETDQNAPTKQLTEKQNRAQSNNFMMLLMVIIGGLFIAVTMLAILLLRRRP